jgi:CheY-like chemotaxis protein
MRPKKKILLVSASEERASVLRFMLMTSCFAVTSVTDRTAALAELEAQPFDLLLCDLPLSGISYLVEDAHEAYPFMPSIVLGASAQDIASKLCASAIYQRLPSSAELLEQIKILVARKRGPKPQTKPSLPVPVIHQDEIARIA